jgi:hypothetical protein
MRKVKHLSKATQLEIWKSLLGSREDARSAKEIIDDIYARRTAGRDVKL